VAAFLEARELRVARDPGNARYARVVVVRRDPLADLPGLPWPNLPAPGLSIWQPVPVGINEDGELVTVGLIERNVLIGGEPGGGKSVGQSMLLDRYGHLFPRPTPHCAPGWMSCSVR
jgi:hypothetical protein